MFTDEEAKQITDEFLAKAKEYMERQDTIVDKFIERMKQDRHAIWNNENKHWTKLELMGNV